MAAPLVASPAAADLLTSSSILYAGLAAVLLVALQPLLSISSPVFSRYPRLHLQRRVQHAVTNLLLTALCTHASLISRSVVLLVLSYVVVLLLALQWLRRFPAVNSAFIRACGSLLRPHELRGLPAGFFNLLSTLLCVAMNEAAPALVPMPTVRLSLLYEAVGDPVAAVVGTALSPVWARQGKTTAGSIGMLLACSSLTALYLLATHSPLHVSWLLLPPAVCALVERYTCRARGWMGLDDNFTVPVVTCVVVSLLQAVHVLPPL